MYLNLEAELLITKNTIKEKRVIVFHGSETQKTINCEHVCHCSACGFAFFPVKFIIDKLYAIRVDILYEEYLVYGGCFCSMRESQKPSCPTETSMTVVFFFAANKIKTMLKLLWPLLIVNLRINLMRNSIFCSE